MCRDVLVRRRGIEQLSSEAACLNDYRLVFDQPAIPWIEPCFAGIQPDAGNSVYGVLYSLTPETAEQLHTFEGPSYEVISVIVRGCLSGDVKAETYRTRQPSVGALPSQRYLDLLINGAAAASLPEHYISMLKSQRTSCIPALSPYIHGLIEWIEQPERPKRVARHALHAAVRALQHLRSRS